MRAAAAWGATILFGGCSLLTANNRELLEARAALMSGRADAALEALDATRRDDLCAKLDRATIYQAAGMVERSNAAFDDALATIRDFEERASVSAREVGRAGGSLLLNDKTLEYQGEGFEKVLVHALKARNYLMLGDLEAARVEIRNANMRQEEEKERHAAELEETRREAKRERVDLDRLSPEVERQFASLSGVLARAGNLYQNPFATYLSGVVYEWSGAGDDAFIDYKALYESAPSPLVEADLARVGQRVGRAREVADLGISGDFDALTDGDTLVLVDNGFAPERVEVKFPIPEPDTILFAAVPMVVPVPTNLAEVEIRSDEGAYLGRTQMLADIEAMAVRNLHDRYPAILVRQAIRLAAKAVAAHAAKKELGDGGVILSTLFNIITEQADLRGWYALPRSIHVARVRVPAGSESLRLRLLDAAGRPMRDVTVPVARVEGKFGIAAIRYLNGEVWVSTPAGETRGEEG